MNNNTPLVSLSNVSFCYAETPILENINFALNQGQHWLIQGTNGSGKTTLLKLLCGLINPKEGIGPSRQWNNDSEISFSPIIGRKVAVLVTPQTQDLYLQKGWNITGRECVAAGLRGTPMLYEELSSEEESSVDLIFSTPEISYLAHKSMIEMSRGESRKVLLARAIAAKPKILVLDELLHELDPASREDVIRISTRLALQGISFIYTSHRSDEILPFTTHVTQIENKKLINSRSFQSDAHYVSNRLDNKNIPLLQHQTDSDILIQAQDCKLYIKDTKILHNINFTLRSGMHTAIVGSNGSGKSTMLRMLYGNISPALGGIITRFNTDQNSTLSDIQMHMGYASAELQASIDPNDSVLDVILSRVYNPACEKYKTDQYLIDRAQEILKLLHVNVSLDYPFGNLSYGMQRKTILARAFISRPKVLLLDEPMSGLDSLSRKAITQLIEEASNEGSTIIMAIHHSEDIPKCIKQIITIEHGTIKDEHHLSY